MPDDTPTAWYGKLQHWDPLSPGNRWENQDGRVTLAGDAAHPMTFQRGQGLNHAITDALKLVQAIERHWYGGNEFDQEERVKAIEGYENEMVARTSEEVRLGEMNTVMMHDWARLKESPVMTRGMDKVER